MAKIPNKRELQQIELNHSSDINTKDFVNIYEKCTSEPYSFLVNDTTLASNNPLKLRKNLFGIYNKNHDIRLEMKNYNTILIEKQPKYQFYHQEIFINMDILLVKIYYHLISNK